MMTAVPPSRSDGPIASLPEAWIWGLEMNFSLGPSSGSFSEALGLRKSPWGWDAALC